MFRDEIVVFTFLRCKGLDTLGPTLKAENLPPPTPFLTRSPRHSAEGLWIFSGGCSTSLRRCSRAWEEFRKGCLRPRRHYYKGTSLAYSLYLERERERCICMVGAWLHRFRALNEAFISSVNPCASTLLYVPCHQSWGHHRGFCCQATIQWALCLFGATWWHPPRHWGLPSLYLTIRNSPQCGNATLK